MKLPWDKEYLKISFHVIFTIVTIYILGLIIKNIYMFNEVANHIISFIATILSPLIIALVFSYVLNPVVEFFHNKTELLIQKLGIKNKTEQDTRFKVRTKGTIVTYIIIFVIIGIIIKLIVGKIGSINADMIANMVTASIEEFSDLVTVFYK